METIARIRRDHLVKGVPIKKLARDLRVSKNTIRKVVRGDATSHTYERKIQPMPKLGMPPVKTAPPVGCVGHDCDLAHLRAQDPADAEAWYASGEDRASRRLRWP